MSILEVSLDLKTVVGAFFTCVTITVIVILWIWRLSDNLTEKWKKHLNNEMDNLNVKVQNELQNLNVKVHDMKVDIRDDMVGLQQHIISVEKELIELRKETQPNLLIHRLNDLENRIIRLEHIE